MFICFCLCWVFIVVNAFSSFGDWGPLSSRGVGRLTAVASPVAEHGLWAVWASAVAAPRLERTDSQPVAPRQAGPSWIRDLTHVYCICRQSICHWAIRKALHWVLDLDRSLSACPWHKLRVSRGPRHPPWLVPHPRHRRAELVPQGDRQHRDRASSHGNTAPWQQQLRTSLQSPGLHLHQGSDWACIRNASSSY